MESASESRDYVLPADEYYGDQFVADQVRKYKQRDRNHWGERMGTVLSMVDEAVSGPADVLDLACGIGAFTIAAAKRGHRVTGLDYSETALAAAEKLAREEGADCKFVHGDATKLPFEDGSFDLVIASDIIEHLFDPPLLRMFRECHRVLRKGGAFVLHTTPTRYLYLMSPLRALPLVPFAWLPQPKLDRLVELYEKYPFTAAYKAVYGDTWVNMSAKRGHCNCPDVDHLRGMLESAGFELSSYRADDAPADLKASRSYAMLARIFRNSRHLRGHIWGICRKR
ncbi:MAG: methyltransferase domain-containing protein [Polyangiaceae bacterium]